MDKLPAHPTQFIGRQREIQEITQLLTDPTCHLLSLVGPGGIGKTRLALEAARRQRDQFPDGVHWVDLQSGQTADYLETAVADALSLPLSGHGDPRQQLLHYLQDKSLLLVVDNFEQLLDDAGFLSEILQQGTAVRLLVTSRAALHLQEEWLYPVSGLPYPPADQESHAGDGIESYSAVQLFVERVRRVRPNFSPADEQAALLHICRLVEGVPLALELAAAWARSLDCATIAAEIESNLTFLTTPLRNVSQRHRSMQAVFKHSWALLTVEEQDVFSQLAVFRGGFSREAAMIVAGATLPLLASLVDKSLLHPQPNGRYRMHELLRQYLAAQAEADPGKHAAAQQRHASYYAKFLHQRAGDMSGSRQREAAQEIVVEMDNIYAAWNWAVSHGHIEAVSQAADALDMYCQVQSKYVEGQRLFAQVTRQPAFAGPEADPLRACVLNNLGWFHIRLGQFGAATDAFRQSQAIYQQREMEPPTSHSSDPRLGFSSLAAIRGEYETAESLAVAALATATSQQNWWNVAAANYLLAETAIAQGDYERAQQAASAAYAATETTQDRWFMAYCLYEMGQAATALGDYIGAHQHLTACYDLRQALDDPEGIALAMNSLGEIARRQGQFSEAESLFRQSLAIYRQINDQGGLATAHHGLGRTAVAQQAYETARQAFCQALQIASDIQFTALQLAILADVGDFLLRTGRAQPGLSLLRLCQDHPAAGQETKMMAAQQLQRYKTAVSPAVFTTATPPADLDTAASLALRELLAPVTESAIPPPPPPAAATELIEPLTDRELDVLHLIAEGQTNRQIANTLTVVVGTVKSHNNRIFGKLGVNNRAQAIVRARELGLIP